MILPMRRRAHCRHRRRHDAAIVAAQLCRIYHSFRYGRLAAWLSQDGFAFVERRVDGYGPYNDDFAARELSDAISSSQDERLEVPRLRDSRGARRHLSAMLPPEAVEYAAPDVLIEALSDRVDIDSPFRISVGRPRAKTRLSRRHADRLATIAPVADEGDARLRSAIRRRSRSRAEALGDISIRRPAARRGRCEIFRAVLIAA